MRAIPYDHRLLNWDGRRGIEWTHQWMGTGDTWKDALSWWESLAVGSVIQYTARVKAMEEEHDVAVIWSCCQGVEGERSSIDLSGLDSGWEEGGGGWFLKGLGCAARDAGRAAGE